VNAKRAPRLIELRTCGANDLDGLRAASLLHAYFHAEQLRAFRRLLWRRLALATALFLVGALSIPLPHRAIYTGVAMLVAAGIWPAVLEWRADHKVHALLADLAA
jgi:hypothetical protein